MFESYTNINKLYILITYILKKGIIFSARSIFKHNLIFREISSGIFSEQFSSNFEQFHNIRAEHFRAEIRKNCSKLLENARIADFDHSLKGRRLHNTLKVIFSYFIYSKKFFFLLKLKYLVVCFFLYIY